LRRRHFPPGLNLIPAHLTLFHRLPGEQELRLLADVAATARRAPFPLTATAPLLLGRGVAIRVEGEGLPALRRELARTWAELLGLQDRQGFRPHVTIQNKVAPEVARALHEGLAATFQPFVVEARGLLLWRYLGGPWERVAVVPFRSDTSRR
jgi:2'-5' RNA ligase